MEGPIIQNKFNAGNGEPGCVNKSGFQPDLFNTFIYKLEVSGNE